jgi:hypothetical protein
MKLIVAAWLVVVGLASHARAQSIQEGGSDRRYIESGFARVYYPAAFRGPRSCRSYVELFDNVNLTANQHGLVVEAVRQVNATRTYEPNCRIKISVQKWTGGFPAIRELTAGFGAGIAVCDAELSNCDSYTVFMTTLPVKGRLPELLEIIEKLRR